MTYLIVGATGRVASHLTRQLLASGKPLRLLVRNADKARTLFADTLASAKGIAPEIIEGAFDDPVTLARAFDGANVAFLALGTSPEQVVLEQGLVDAAAKARLPHLVRLSVLGAHPNTIYEIGRRHGVLDDHLKASGLPYTVLRPAYFSSNLLLGAPSIAARGEWAGSAPTGRVALIDTRDVAEAAAVVMLRHEPRNETIELSGPESLSFAQMAERLGAILGRPIRYVAMEPHEIRQVRAALGLPAWRIDIGAGIDNAMEAGLNDRLTSGMQRLTGRPGRKLDEFIADHRLAFEPAASVS
jgi:uncharacterized protein YbjT (DUF2867 family)